MSSSLECICGFIANNQKQLLKHNVKCSNFANDNNDFTCTKCKKIFATKYNRDRHTKTCIVGEQQITKNEFMKKYKQLSDKIENDLHLIKAFEITYNSSNDNDKEKQLNGLFFNTYKTLINKYLPIISSNNDSEIQINNLLQEETSNATITNSTNSHNQTTNNNTNTNTNNNSHNQTTNNIDNSNNQTTNNHNHITINNNNKINVVYPFGYENIYFLSDYEMVDILTSKNCIIAAMEKIYSNVENQNFMKRNMNREQITVIDEKCKIKVMNDDVFKKKIIKNTFSYLQMMFYHCKNKLRIEHQIMLWQNLRLLDELIKENITMREEKNMYIEIKQIMDTITNMVAENNENPEYREKFDEIKNSITSEEYKKLFNEKLNAISAKMAEFNNDYQTRNITLDFVRNQIWNRNPDIDPLLNLNNLVNHIDLHDIETTPRFIFYKDMELLEENYLRDNGKNTSGNIDSLCNIREKVANSEFKKYQDKFKPKLKESKILERQIKNSKKFNARDKMSETKPTIIGTLAPAARNTTIAN
jgi:hypothetical protein